jgi:NAD(P)-dependent dehydrogenase (short-subunit alcohol dehydrogenase family)
METNFFGSIKVLKGCIPFFRQTKRGIIVQMSSISGFTVTSAAGIMYSASKFALEGVAEGLAMQLGPFGVKTLLVEPGLFRTNWLSGSYATPAIGMSKEYEGTALEDALRGYPELDGKQEGDPEKAARVILDVVEGKKLKDKLVPGTCLRLPLGNDGMDKAKAAIARLQENFDAVDTLGRSTGFGSERPDA